MINLSLKNNLLVCVLLLTSCSISCSSVQSFVDVPFSDYLTPLMYGAVGDGKQDDTDALRKALYESNKQGKVLYFPSGFIFRVTGTLNFYNDKYQSYVLSLMGCIPIKSGSYVPKKYGGISIASGVSLFKSASISGSIDRVCITGQRDLSVRVFDHCVCKALVIQGCNISNLGVLFSDTPVSGVSQFTQNTFLTLYYFSKNEDTSSGLTDSTISFNYINGGAEQDDNSCFEWAYYNGSTISNNFIDYYRTIYYPKAVKKQTFVGPLSYANQYQVFRYLYADGNDILTSITFSSVSDSFNWNDPATLEKLQRFKALTYKGKDGKTYEIPPYIAVCHSAWNISIRDAKIEQNMKSLIFIHSGLTEYEYNRFEVSFIGNNPYKKGQINYKKGDPTPFYNNGKFLQNEVRIDGIVEELDELPRFTMGWSADFHGHIVQVKGQRYKAINIFDGKKWRAEWQSIMSF